MTNTLTFTCSICGEPSTAICAYCTKDSCGNHLCDRCGRCSDCCECEVRLEEPAESAQHGAHLLPADQRHLVDDLPDAEDVETAAEDTFTEEPREEMSPQQGAVDAVTAESREQPPAEPSVDAPTELPPPDAPPADRHHE